ncbi:GNAT family N-acetyltransferase [Halosimplex aquaticum]
MLRGTAECTVGVLDGYRRHGIGSHLLQRCVEWAASRGAERCTTASPRPTARLSTSSNATAGRSRRSARSTTRSTAASSTK